MSGLPKEIGFTKVPHFLIEQVMPQLRGSEVQVVLLICRKTFGYHKKFDPIALTQFADHTGLKKKTVIEAIRSLVKKRIIIKKTKTIPYQYGINLFKHDKKKGSKITPRPVKKANPSKVQKLNPQKKDSKETKKDTTSSRDDLPHDINHILEVWNDAFRRKMDPDCEEHIEMIKSALSDFTVDQICKAIFNRSQAQYYKTIPWLRDKPNMFFCIPEYIRNDLQRKPDGIFSYDEMTKEVHATSGMTTDNFEIIPESKDEEGRPLWKLKKA